MPLLLAVDDNPDVLRTIEDDLRHRYGTRYQIQGVRSGAAARELLGQIGEPAEVALVLADQRLGRITGREVLAAARTLAPAARRVLLVLPEDTALALEAITAGQAPDYLVNPRAQPDARIFPL